MAVFIFYHVANTMQTAKLMRQSVIRNMEVRDFCLNDAFNIAQMLARRICALYAKKRSNVQNVPDIMGIADFRSKMLQMPLQDATLA